MHFAPARDEHLQQPHGIDRAAGAGDGEDERERVGAVGQRELAISTSYAD